MIATTDSRPGPSVPVRIATGLVQVYRVVVSPFFPPSCRYTPTCSEYALEALRRHGVLRGGWMTVRRIGRCHPWHPGGHDPVP